MHADPLLKKARVLDQLSALLVERRALEVRRHVGYSRLAYCILDANDMTLGPHAAVGPGTESLKAA
jgi:hypothetical protein